MRINGKRILFIFLCVSIFVNLRAQSVIFTFDDIPIHSSLPSAVTVNGLTAHFSATGQGYSIQSANVLGFTPAGFYGNIIYPNSIYLADLLIKFDQKITSFSIMYCCQELGCDDAATMKVTAYKNGIYVGAGTRTATFPGTWPTDTLSCSFETDFDSVVVHYNNRPPTCQDYGVIYMADNMIVKPKVYGINPEENSIQEFTLNQNYPNPFNPSTDISYTLPYSGFAIIRVWSLNGQLISTLINKYQQAGKYTVKFTAVDLSTGIYIYSLALGNTFLFKKMVFLK